MFLRRSRFPRLALAILCTLVPAFAGASECDADRYFSAADAAHAAPLPQPSPELTALRRQASAGHAAAQRSLAVSYETGYLVSRCADKALYWYREAGKRGDKLAQEWLDAYARLEKMRSGPECVGARCADSAGGNTTLELIADRRGHFHAPLTINGVTVNGMIDTGASLVSMSAQVARQLGIVYANGRPMTMTTANGTIRAQTVTAREVTVGSITLRDVAVAVSEGDMPLLIGMSFLRRLEMEIRGSSMTLSQR
jgi:clan AA aspartic protease (TIGR02281 family)